jgi:S-formylglutathione hydrolase FrmB
MIRIVRKLAGCSGDRRPFRPLSSCRFRTKDKEARKRCADHHPRESRSVLKKGIAVKRIVGLGTLLALILIPCTAQAGGKLRQISFNRHNRRLAGQVIDYTHNHGEDRRIWSAALSEPRDLYVYLPPGFDPSQKYPAILWLHGFMQDEQSFLWNQVVDSLDEAIADGRLPPVIVAVPDGTLNGSHKLLSPSSFFINSNLGNFEDYIVHDVWGFLEENYPIRPEREAHVLAGVSMGGFAAFNLAMKHSESFKVAVGVFPPLNLRWVDCHCNYRAKFDPECWGWRTSVRGREVIGKFYLGLVKIRLRLILDDLFDPDDMIESLSRENPIEIIDRLGIKEGQLSMYVAYGGKDGYNIDTQVESFLYRTRERGLSVGVGYLPRGRHNMITAQRLFPGIVDWLGPLLDPYRTSPVAFAPGSFQK